MASINKYKNGIPHGYWEYRNNDNTPYAKGYYVNGLKEGYWEWSHDNGKIWCKGNFINDVGDGLWVEYDTFGILIETSFICQ